MNFEVDGMWVIQPFDPYQGSRFTEPVDDVEWPNLMDQLYQLTAGRQEDYINPTTIGSTSWWSIQIIKVGCNATMEDW